MISFKLTIKSLFPFRIICKRARPVPWCQTHSAKFSTPALAIASAATWDAQTTPIQRHQVITWRSVVLKSIQISENQGKLSQAKHVQHQLALKRTTFTGLATILEYPLAKFRILIGFIFFRIVTSLLSTLTVLPPRSYLLPLCVHQFLSKFFWIYCLTFQYSFTLFSCLGQFDRWPCHSLINWRFD